MLDSSDEIERPTEWLNRLQEDCLLYERLLNESGGLARAAYRLARAHCRVAQVSSRVPTLRELGIAAEKLSKRSPRLRHVPSPVLLAEECEYAGLPVIMPIERPLVS